MQCETEKEGASIHYDHNLLPLGPHVCACASNLQRCVGGEQTIRGSMSLSTFGGQECFFMTSREGNERDVGAMPISPH